ncbi:MAG: TIM barrel protein, partial [Bacteroidota bacterium]
METRRSFIKKTGMGVGACLLGTAVTAKAPQQSYGSLKQVIAAWPFMANGPKWSAEIFLKKVASLGVSGVELFPAQQWGMLKEYDMVCAATKSHGFVRGMNNKNHWPECFELLEKAINVTGEAGFPNVMTFTGMEDTSNEVHGSRVSLDEGLRNCVEGYKKIAQLAEKKGVTLILEPLNTKINEPMKGHPGYQGDHIDYCVEIVKSV